MKKYLIAAIFSLICTGAYADGSPCEDVGKMIANLEHQKTTSRLSTADKGVLAAGYQTYYGSGCTESQLQGYFKPGEKPKSRGEVR